MMRNDVRMIREMPMRPSSSRPLRSAWSPRVLLLLVPALLAGCSYLLGVRTEPPRLFVLSTTPADGTHPLPASVVLGFGPVDMPGYLDRRGIVRRIDPNRLEESRTDLWAEPLGAGFKSVVEQNLRLRLPGTPIRTFPWPMGSQPDLAVAIEVSRFELAPGGAVELDARWSVRSPRDGAMLAERDTALTGTVSGPGTENVVAAMSRATGELSDEIARAVADAAGRERIRHRP